MTKLNYLTQFYISLVIIFAVTLGVLSFRFGKSQTFLLRDLALLTIVATLAEGYNLALAHNYTVSAHPAAHIATIFLLPPPAALTIVLISILIDGNRSRA